MRYVYLVTVLAVVLVVSVLGFRGHTFTSPPMDVFSRVGFSRHEASAEISPAGGQPIFCGWTRGSAPAGPYRRAR